jgi:hypothetical protein
MRRTVLPHVGGWSRVPEETSCGSAQTRRRRRVRIATAGVKILTRIDAPGGCPNTWNTVLVAWRSVRCSPPLISMCLSIEHGETSDRWQACADRVRRVHAQSRTVFGPPALPVDPRSVGGGQPPPRAPRRDAGSRPMRRSRSSRRSEMFLAAKNFTAF